MFVEGRGNNDPVAPNDNVAANKKKNRRVEIFILGGKPAK
jgi:flagellar motor protein MotB